MPVWTSSKTSAAPTSSHASRAACSSSSGIGWTPDSPSTGSIRTAAVPSPTAVRTASTDGSTARKPGTSGANGACLDSWGVAESAPYVRPWNAPWNTTISPRGRALRTSFSAASLASAPELQKNTAEPNERSTSRSASRTIGAFQYRFDTCISRAACSWTAATTCGWQWPVLQTAIPARKSRYSTPSASTSTHPCPDVNSTGKRAYVGASALMKRAAISVPWPASVNSSSSSECCTRPSTMCA